MGALHRRRPAQEGPTNMSFIVISRDGPACPRCGRPMQIREHRRIGPKQLRRWFCCMHRDCKTTIVHREEYKVVNTKIAKITQQADRRRAGRRRFRQWQAQQRYLKERYREERRAQERRLAAIHEQLRPRE
jgi:hypothetical protein